MAFEFAVSTGHDPAQPNAIEANPDPGVKPATGNAWEIVKIQPNGAIVVKTNKLRGTGASYALTYVYSPKKQLAKGHVRADASLSLWIGKSKLLDGVAAKGMTGHDFTAELPLGWTPVLVKVLDAGNGFQVGLQFEGDGVRTATKPE